MGLAKVYKSDLLILDEVELADTFMKRFMGLMFRKGMPQNHGLLLKPCNEIHTFSMRFPIDAVFLNSEGTILKIEAAMMPNKIGKTVKQAKSVLELCAHTAEKYRLQVGDVLKIINL